MPFAEVKQGSSQRGEATVTFEFASGIHWRCGEAVAYFMTSGSD